MTGRLRQQACQAARSSEKYVASASCSLAFGSVTYRCRVVARRIMGADQSGSRISGPVRIFVRVKNRPREIRPAPVTNTVIAFLCAWE